MKQSRAPRCVCCEAVAGFGWEQGGLSLRTRTTPVARATLPLSATHHYRGRQQRGSRYGGVQSDEDGPEAFAEGEKCL